MPRGYRCGAHANVIGFHDKVIAHLWNRKRRKKGLRLLCSVVEWHA
jgi:hypothetical protein